MNGKGSSPRNCFSQSYRENYESIFGKKPLDGQAKTNTNKDKDDKNKDKRSGRSACRGLHDSQ